MKLLRFVFVLFLLSIVVASPVRAIETSKTFESVDETEKGENEKSEDIEEDDDVVNSYEMFWPISAGRTAGDPLFFLKTLKEKVRGLLIFSDYRKADYNITLSEKRLVEAEKLIINGDFQNAEKSLNANADRIDEAVELIGEVEDKGQDTTDLKNTLASSLKKQKKLIDYLATTNDGLRDVLNKHSDRLSLILPQD